MYLPDLKQPTDPTKALTGTGTILLVDDNDAFRNIIRTFLESSGYNVLEARSAAEATAIVGQHTGTIDLLLTDVVLPGVNGDQLSDYVRFLFPTINVLYMSGYGNAVKFESAGSQAGAHMLPKPFSKGTLLLAVGQLLHWREHNTEKVMPMRAWAGFPSSAQSLA
ncbi:MAG TPA: response regulator [Candidatus Acidoferrum sp.]|jgi:two-component system cell cycle sensor histidine kinase/response regulator CckA